MRLYSVLLLAAVWAAPTAAEDASAIVLPPNPSPRPDMAITVDAGEQGDDGQRIRPPNPTVRADFEQAPPSEPDPQNGDSACLAALRASGAVFEVRGRHEGAGRCGIDDAVAMSSINGVTLQPAALLTCQTALTYSQFWSGFKAPEAQALFGSRPQTVYVAASYACRGRNNVAGARMSEHAFGRAIDIRAIDFEDGQTWTVRPHSEGADDPAAQFQAAIRQAACGPFNTILGPGSDGHHQDHIHFDTAQRSSTYCR